MSFATNIKRLFGFGEPDEDDDGLLSDSHDHTEPSDIRTESDNTGGQAEIAVAMPEIDESRFSDIFDSVVRNFNEALPGFLSESVDVEKQKQYLYETLNRDLKDYLAAVAARATEYALSQIRQRDEANSAEMTRLREETHRLENQRSSIKEQQLSSERQRRALSERVKDLEAQIGSLEAEREQFELENKSLLNKLKVAEVQPGVIEELTAEINRLKGHTSQDDTPATVSPDEIQELEKELERLKSVIEMKDEANRTNLAMLNDLQHELVAERNTNKALTSELDEARQLVADFAEVQDQMSNIETLIARRDEKIAQLKAANKDLRKQNARLKDDVEAWKERNETPGLFAMTEDVKDTKAMADAGTHSHASSGSDASGGSQTERMSANALSADDLAEIDSEFEDTAWLVSSPADGKGLKTELTDAEFGYHEPPRKPQMPHNDAQLSLF